MIRFADLYLFLLYQLWWSSVLTPPPTFITQDHPCQLPLLPPLLSTLPLSGQLQPVPTTSSPPAPLAYSMMPRRGTEVITSQYTAQPYYTFAECRFSSTQTPPPLLPPLLMCNNTSRPASAVEVALLVAAPPFLGNPPGLVPCRG